MPDASGCSDNVLQNADLLAVLVVEARHALVDIADDFVVDRAEHVRNALARQKRSILIVAEERRRCADLCLGNVRDIDHAHIHADSADDGRFLAADAEGDVKWVEEHLDRPEGAIPAIRCQIGPVIGSHVGPGMVAVVFWGDDRREKISIADRIANKINSGE
mgnify:CR=1 FL=1